MKNVRGLCKVPQQVLVQAMGAETNSSRAGKVEEREGVVSSINEIVCKRAGNDSDMQGMSSSSR